jgi:outer membrane protein
MKNFTIGLNVVLVIAVAVLFYLHFSSGSKDGKVSASGTKAVPQGDFKIAYFEIDSIEAHFDYYKEVSNSIQAKAQENSKQLNQLKQTFADKYQELQRSAQTMTQAELNSKQQELMQMENESMKKMLDVRQKISDYLKEYNVSKGYAFIVGNNDASIAFYYKDAAYDITADVIKGLNERYKKKN